MRKINVLLFGYGNTGRRIAGYVEQHGGRICAIVESDRRLWGEIAHGVSIGGDGEYALRCSEADIAVISVGNRLDTIAPLVRQCLSHGVNAITTSEESLFPYSTSPVLFAELDALAKEHRCTFSATGFQDCFWVHAVTTFASSCSRIDRIRGVLRYNVDEYGASLAADHGVGMSVAEFNRRFNGDFIPSYIWNANELLAAKLGWGVARQTQQCVPYVYHERLYSAACEKVIEKGDCVGMSTVVTTETAFGGVIETECIGKIYVAGDKDECRWSLTGDPSLSFEVHSPKTLEHTAAAIVNRIPQVIAAEPGYITIDSLGPAEYLTFPMFLYI